MISYTTVAIVIGAAILAFALWPKQTKPLPMIRSAPSTLRSDPSEAFMRDVFANSLIKAGKVIYDQHVNAHADNLVSIHRASMPPPTAPGAQPPNG